MALLLLGLKAWAVWATGSNAMLGSLADTALDFIASFATLAGVWIAARPADEDHRVRHGKAEALAAMFQAMLISISAFGLGGRAIQRWRRRWRCWPTSSLAIATDHVHYQSAKRRCAGMRYISFVARVRALVIARPPAALCW